MSAQPTTTLNLLGVDVRRLVLSIHGRRIRAAGADVDDVVQDVMLQIVRHQRSTRSRWDPARGLSSASYTYQVVTTAGLNSLRRHSQEQRIQPAYRHRAEEAVVDERWTGADYGAAMDRICQALDEDDEREMARRLAAGHSVAAAGRAMGLTEDRALELGTRVRALLMGMREGG